MLFSANNDEALLGGCVKCFHQRATLEGVCPLCQWTNRRLLSDDAEYILLAAIIERIGQNNPFARVDASDREVALLEVGDYCEIDESIWLVCEKGPAIGRMSLQRFD